MTSTPLASVPEIITASDHERDFAAVLRVRTDDTRAARERQYGSLEHDRDLLIPGR